MSAEVIILPVVRVERGSTDWRRVAGSVDWSNVAHIDAERYRRERLAVERREMTSLLPCDCGGA